MLELAEGSSSQLEWLVVRAAGEAPQELKSSSVIENIAKDDPSVPFSKQNPPFDSALKQHAEYAGVVA